MFTRKLFKNLFKNFNGENEILPLKVERNRKMK